MAMTFTAATEPRNTEMAASRALFTSAAMEGTASRVGRLALPGRAAFDTPNYVSVTSRGAIPHLTPDNMSRYLSPGPVYMALEDFIEKTQPPLYNIPTTRENRLHSFTGLPSESTTILAARRSKPATTPTGNTAKSVTLFTSTGFRSLTVPEYVEATSLLGPDIVVLPADLPHTSNTPPSKRLVRMVERTKEWVDDFLEGTKPQYKFGSAVFAPVLAVEYPFQWGYLRHLSEDLTEKLSGLAVYDANLLRDVVLNHAPLRELPRLCMRPPELPQDILEQIALGIDVCVVPFVNSVSDSGVALTFTFSPGQEVSAPLPLGVNMWSEEHAAALRPLSEGCFCYTCTRHHRAYLRHLLSAKEMLGWSLLQIHNHHVMGEFFGRIRAALRNGTFEVARARFQELYESSFPAGTGERPRARGHHSKSEYGQRKINETTWIDTKKARSRELEQNAA